MRESSHYIAISNTSNCAHNLNQVKTALLIEERGLSSFNNLTQQEALVLQRMRISRTADREEFMSIFIGKLFGLTGSFPSRLGIKLHLVVDGGVADSIVLAPRTASADRLTTVGDILVECGLDHDDFHGAVLCQGIVLNASTPLYFLRETAQEIDGFIHLVYRIDSKP